MNLSPEDQLRLNVLLAHDLAAIRIDESAMVVHALSPDGEARVTLSPNCRAGQYLKQVRELFSNHALGSPGGYPVFLQRWTRMGQHRDGQLDKLLLLGEPEAVVAVAGAAGLTPELARRVWWLTPDSDTARRMLERDAVVASDIGREIAAFLVDHLAFEDDPMTVITSIRLVLQPGLIAAEVRRRIWSRAIHRNLYYKLGFLEAQPDALPATAAARSVDAADTIASLAGAGNPLAILLRRVLAAEGQAYLAVIEELLEHPTDKFTAAVLFNNLGRYFAGVRHLADETVAVEQLLGTPGRLPATPAPELTMVLEAAPSLRGTIAAVLALSRVDEGFATPILAKTSASGTLLRRKLEPVTQLLRPVLSILRSGPGK
ncbi:MAG: sulfur reduction protein DsrS [Pseudomonadota bacterium]